MGELQKPVGKVFRRLRFQRFLTAFVWSLAAALLVVAVVLGTARGLGRTIPGPEWLPFAIAGGCGLLMAGLIAVFGGASRLDAAVAIDHAFHLSERLSTALTLPENVRETPAGTALLADARKKLKDLDVAAAFGPRLPRRAWVVLIPAALAVSMLFVPQWVQRKVLAKTEVQRIDSKALTKQAQALSKKISSQRQALDKDKYPEAEKLMAQIEKKAEELAKAPPAKKDQLLIEMNKLTDALKERKKQLGNPDQVNRQLQQLKELGQNGPADQLAKELAKGDFKKAAEQLKQLQEKLKSGKMTEAEKKVLEQQLGEMAKKLKDVANMEARKKQLEQALKNGGLSKEQYEREMDKLKQQSKSLQQLQRLASKLGQAQEALKKGDTKQAADSLGMTEQQLAQMAKQLEEMEALDSAMAEVQDAKNGMANDGMNQLGQMGDGLSDMGMFRRRPGDGLGGRGRGQGDRPEAPDETATYSSKVQQQLRKGKAVLQGFTQPGKTVKGHSVIDIQAEMEAATASAADALSNQRIPKNVEKHIRDYYDQINKGK
jgi:tetratricopeptide (TPR) repeat protein